MSIKIAIIATLLLRLLGLLHYFHPLYYYYLGVDYQNFNYLYQPSGIKANAIKNNKGNTKISNKERESNFYLSLGHIELNSSELISLDYQFIRKRIKIETSANFLVYPKKDILLMGKVGYRLNK